MLFLILTAVVPVVFVLASGYGAGSSGLITEAGAKDFSVFIINLALPCTIFVGVFNFTPHQFEDISYLITLFISLISVFIISMIIGFCILKRTAPNASLFACNSSFPDMAYFGLPILTAVIGSQALLPVITGILITSFFIVPPIVLMLNTVKNNVNSNSSQTPAHTLLITLKQPIVWSPILALILLLLGVKLPFLVKTSIQQIGDVTGGVALFTLGVLLSLLKFRFTLSSALVVILKNILMPAIALSLSLYFHLESVMAKGVVLTMACPSATIGAMFSSKYQLSDDSAVVEIFVGNLLGIFTIAFWIIVVEKVW